jgi:hypothetical protein
MAGKIVMGEELSIPQYLFDPRDQIPLTPCCGIIFPMAVAAGGGNSMLTTTMCVVYTFPALD